MTNKLLIEKRFAIILTVGDKDVYIFDTDNNKEKLKERLKKGQQKKIFKFLYGDKAKIKVVPCELKLFIK